MRVIRRRSAAATVPPTKPTRLVGAVPCEKGAPVTGFVLAQGTHQMGCELLNIGDHGHDLRHQRGLLTSPIARAALVAIMLGNGYAVRR